MKKPKCKFLFTEPCYPQCYDCTCNGLPQIHVQNAKYENAPCDKFIHTFLINQYDNQFTDADYSLLKVSKTLLYCTWITSLQ